MRHNRKGIIKKVKMIEKKRRFYMYMRKRKRSYCSPTFSIKICEENWDCLVNHTRKCENNKISQERAASAYDVRSHKKEN